MQDRIPLRYEKGHLVLYVWLINPKRPNDPRRVRFIIDTGSTHTYLRPNDLIRLDINHQTLDATGTVNLSGTTYNHVPLKELTMILLAGQNRENQDQFLQRNVLLNTLRPTDEEQPIPHHLPALLGMDFLIEQKLSLHIIPTEELAYLEVSDEETNKTVNG